MEKRKSIGRGVLLVADQVEPVTGVVYTREALQTLMLFDENVAKRNPELTDDGELIVDFFEEDL